jgi:hypothetical protein
LIIEVAPAYPHRELQKKGDPMKKLLWGTAALAIMNFGAQTAFGGDTASDFAKRGDDYKAAQIERLDPRLHVPQLVGKVVPGPVTVQGTGYQTLVVGNHVVNGGGAAGSVVDAQCPRKGGRVVIVGNRVDNLGYVGGDGSNTGVVVVNCPLGYSGSVDMNSNQVTNLGLVNQNK